MLRQFSNGSILFRLKCAHLLFQNYSDILKLGALQIASHLQIPMCSNFTELQSEGIRRRS